MTSRLPISVLTVLAASLLVAIPLAGEDAPDGRVWGATLDGVAISIEPSQPSWKVGEEMQIRVWMKNFGNAPVRLLTRKRRLNNYRIAVFDNDGRPVRKSEVLERAENAARNRKMRSVSESVTDLAPGEMTRGFVPLPISEWFDIKRPGTYLVLVMNRLASWQDGFLISNMARFRVTK